MTPTEQVLAGNEFAYLQVYADEKLEGLNEVEVLLLLLREGAGESLTIASAKGVSIAAACENLDRQLAPRLLAGAVRAFWEEEEDLLNTGEGAGGAQQEGQEEAGPKRNGGRSRSF